MLETKRLVKYDSYNHKIIFSNKINSFIIGEFCAAVDLALKAKRKYEPLHLDFSAVEQPYPNGLLAVITTISDLRENGIKIRITLPNNANVRKLFGQRNWAHYLCPDIYKLSESTLDRHLVLRQFKDFTDIPKIVKDVMDVVLRNMTIPRDIFPALEWSINEICDNVINHSDSKVGGFVEVMTYTKNDTIAFVVADAGKGILNSLREGIPSLRTDTQAIGEAIKAGVTRNKQFGQGNGLAGSLRITTLSGGSLDITSGTGRFYATTHDSNHKEGQKGQYYKGTLVSGNIKMSKGFSIVKALDFGGPNKYVPVDLIELDYEMQDIKALQIKMSSETTGFGTRNAGKQMRKKTENLISSRPGYQIFIDWEGVPVISSSFADEFMGKLFLELGAMNFNDLIRNRNMELLVRGLLDKAISQRLSQAQDPE